MPENITIEIYLKIIIVCIEAVIGSGLSPDKQKKTQDGCNLRGDVPVVDTIVCMEATIQLAQKCDVMNWHTSKMDRYTDFGLPPVQFAPVKCITFIMF